MSDATPEKSNREQQENNNLVIYEDDEIKVLFWDGNSEKIIITFGDIGSLANETRYFADTPLKKLGLSTIGFMAKRANWFPKQSMHLAAEKSFPIISKFKKTIAYGGSMGGYAALKYSNLLQADVVITLCPQWSIDPIECNGNRNGYESYFEPSMTGMGITKEDLAGNIFAFYDPRHWKDSFHMRGIQQLGHKIEAIHVPHSGHQIIPVLAGTKPMSEFITGAEAGDLDGLRTAVNQTRRSSSKRAQIVIEKSSLRHPSLSGKLISNPAHLSILDPQLLSKIDNNILSRIDTQEHQAISLTILGRIMARNKCSIRERLLSNLYRSIELNSPSWVIERIQTHHNTFICYDLASSKLVHRTESDINSQSKILKYVFPFRLTSEFTTTAIIIDGTIYICMPEKSGDLQLEVANAELQDIENYIVITKEAKKIRLKVFGNYVCANRRGGIEFDRPSASHWEAFSISPQYQA
jgi:hypothetical protein